MIEAVKEITIGGMATLALFANIMSICLIVIALLWFLIRVLKNGRGLKQSTVSVIRAWELKHFA